MSKKPIKKKNRRNSTKHPALKRQYNLKSRADLVDYDYLEKLNKEELDYLNRFTEESIMANFNHGGKRIHTKKEHELESYNKNNARNRCIYTKSKAKNDLFFIDDLFEISNGDKEELELNILDNIDNPDSDTDQ